MLRTRCALSYFLFAASLIAPAAQADCRLAIRQALAIAKAIVSFGTRATPRPFLGIQFPGSWVNVPHNFAPARIHSFKPDGQLGYRSLAYQDGKLTIQQSHFKENWITEDIQNRYPALRFENPIHNAGSDVHVITPLKNTPDALLAFQRDLKKLVAELVDDTYTRSIFNRNDYLALRKEAGFENLKKDAPITLDEAEKLYDFAMNEELINNFAELNRSLSAYKDFELAFFRLSLLENKNQATFVALKWVSHLDLSTNEGRLLFDKVSRFLENLIDNFDRTDPEAASSLRSQMYDRLINSPHYFSNFAKIYVSLVERKQKYQQTYGGTIYDMEVRGLADDLNYLRNRFGPLLNGEEAPTISIRHTKEALQLFLNFVDIGCKNPEVFSSPSYVHDLAVFQHRISLVLSAKDFSLTGNESTALVSQKLEKIYPQLKLIEMITRADAPYERLKDKYPNEDYLLAVTYSIGDHPEVALVTRAEVAADPNEYLVPTNMRNWESAFLMARRSRKMIVLGLYEVVKSSIPQVKDLVASYEDLELKLLERAP